jgi:hypothetical protein
MMMMMVKITVMMVMRMERFVIVQTQLSDETIKKLKEVTGENTVKEALSKAIMHYIGCEHAKVHVGEVKKAKRRGGGRYPVYLANLIAQAKSAGKL